MRREPLGGALLILAALTGALVLALHPTGHDIMDPVSGATQARLGSLIHAVAIAGLPLGFLGFLALWRSLDRDDLGTGALVLWGFGGLAVLGAAVASGFVSGELLRRSAEAGAGAEADLWHQLATVSGLFNQGYAAVNVVAWASAILLWGVAMLRARPAMKAPGVTGLVVAVLVLAGYGSGHLGLDVHGFGIITFVQSAWMLWVGVILWRGRLADRDA